MRSYNYSYPNAVRQAPAPRVPPPAIIIAPAPALVSAPVPAAIQIDPAPAPALIPAPVPPVQPTIVNTPVPTLVPVTPPTPKPPTLLPNTKICTVPVPKPEPVQPKPESPQPGPSKLNPIQNYPVLQRSAKFVSKDLDQTTWPKQQHSNRILSKKKDWQNFKQRNSSSYCSTETISETG